MCGLLIYSAGQGLIKIMCGGLFITATQIDTKAVIYLLFIYLFIYLFVYSFICLFIHLFIWLIDWLINWMIG